MAERRECPECGNMVPVRKDGNLRAHKNHGEICAGGPAPARRSGESIEQKALRYIREGRVHIQRIDEYTVTATVQGSKDDPYVVRFNGTAWVCNCEAQVWRCTHVAAVQLVVRRDPVERESQARDEDQELSEQVDELLGGRWLQRTVGGREEIEV